MSVALSFFEQAWPTWLEFWAVAPGSLILAGGQLSLSKSLREWGKWKAGYSRKIFHVQVFLTAAYLGHTLGLGSLCVYGVAVSLWVGWSLLDPKGLGRALIREEDFPHGRRYVILPYLSTLLGGLVCQGLLGTGATVGLLIVGVCDAIAEPVGLRWGRHPYRWPKIPWLRESKRTWEGSVAILVSSLMIFLWGGFEIGLIGLGWLIWSLIGSLGVTLVESLSPHGMDNFTLQIFGAGWIVMGMSTLPF